MNVYISGPMSGHDDFNFPAFHAVAQKLIEEGHNPVNPANLPQALYCAKTGRLEVVPYCILLDTCLETIAIMADAILLLPGWEFSNGAKREYNLAVKLGLEVLPYPVEICDSSDIQRD